jgi:predicted transcriptional regulator
MAQDQEATDASIAVSLRLSADTTAKLSALARRTQRTHSFLANEAIAAYVERELAVTEGIERGLADMQVGRVTPHREAMSRLRQTIAGARKDP